MSIARTGSAPPPIPGRIWKIAAVTGAGAFMAMLDATVANLAIESIRADLGSTLAVVQWIASGYLIALAVSLPAAGWLGARYGYGRLWAVSLAAFIGGSALCAVAPDPLTLIAARFLQGLAAGLMVPAGQAVIGAAASGDQLGRLFGVLGVVISLGPAVGPAVGGLILQVASWRWLFWINVPVGVAALLAARGLVPRGEVDADRRLDRLGLALLGVGLPLLLYGATEIGATGATTFTLAMAAIGAVLTGLFIFNACRVTHPLIDLRLLRGLRFSAATLTTGFTGANMYGGLLLLPLYLQLVTGRGTVDTGVMLLAMGLGSAAGLYLGGVMTDRHGAGPVVLVGGGLLTITTLPFLLPTSLGTAWLIALLVVRGVGLALAQMPAMTAAYAAAMPQRIGDAVTLVNIVQRIGGATGAIGVVILLAQLGGSESRSAYPWAFALLLLVSLLTLATGMLLRRATGEMTDKPQNGSS